MVSAFVDMIAGIPSVIVSFAGMLTLVPFLEHSLDLAAGESVLAAAMLALARGMGETMAVMMVWRGKRSEEVG